jgi:hypothetical protein
VTIFQPWRNTVKEKARRQCLLCHHAGKVDIGIEIGGRNADGGAGDVQLGFRSENVGPPMDEVGRQTDRNLTRESKIRQREVGRAPLPRRFAD